MQLTGFRNMQSSLPALVALMLSLVTATWAASKETTLHSFNCDTEGCGPFGALVLDATGNLYGTTGGTVFKLARPATPGRLWTLSVLHWFTLKEGEGLFAGVVFDTMGDLYGTAVDGGTHDVGTVFELSPGSDGWTETTLYNFCSEGGGYCTDGEHPFAGVVVDRQGNVYGLTRDAGPYNGGVAFELTQGSGGWTETVLYGFGAKSDDGGGPYFAPVFDGAEKHLYGTTEFGPTGRFGTVFQLRPTSGGWKERVLHSFRGGDGSLPYGGLVLDAARNLYGTTSQGGPHNQGTVFKLSPGAHGHWKETLVYDFPNIQQGGYPLGTLAIDKQGTLYGIAGGGGGCGGTCGLIYQLAPQAHGKWKYAVLHKFNGSDGMWPQGGLVLDKQQKHLYGTTKYGGAYDAGVVFEVTP